MTQVHLQAGTSIVIPVYGGGTALGDLVERILAEVLDAGAVGEVVLVDDASRAPTADVARALVSDHRVKLLRLARNSGQHAALLAGVREARHDVIVTIDDDLQNPPGEIPRLLERLAVGDVDVVYGFAPRTSHSAWRRFASGAVRRMLAFVVGKDQAMHMGPFRAFRTSLREGFKGAVGPGVSLDVLLSWSTERFGHVEVAHETRPSGRSGYTLRRLVRFGFDTLTGYSTALLGFVTFLGIAAVLFGAAVLAWVLGRYLIDGTSVAGFPFLASTIALFSGAQMLSIGIVGQYLGRIHLRTQGRPTYHVAERLTWSGDPRVTDA